MNVLMPQLGETVAEGKVATWFKSQGDHVEVGENLFEIETDKVTMEVQALNSGVLSEIRVQSGETVPVGTIVAVIGESGAEAQTGAPADAPGKVPASPSPLAGEGREGGRQQSLTNEGFASDQSVAGAPPPLKGTSLPPRGNGRRPPFKVLPFAETDTPTGSYGKAEGPLGIKVTPLARRLIAQNGIDLRGLAEAAKANGAWRIGRAEVEAALTRQPASPAQSARPSPLPSPLPQGERERVPEIPGQVTPFNNIRRQTGQRLTESWQTIPHVFQATEIDFSAVDRVRRARKKDFADRHGVSLTYLPFIARAVCIAIGDFPLVNARIEGDGLVVSSEVNLGIAVDLSHAGLVVPVIRNADELTAGGLARAIVRMTDKARSGKLMPDDYSGGTYSISNNGSFGTLFTTPIINPPQVAILSTDGVRKRAVVIEDETGDSITIRPMGTLVHSFDHRAFDGAYSGSFLARLKEIIETKDWSADLS